MAAVLVLPALTASAQNELKGRVTDKKGNPIAGAKVENAKTSEQTTTDMNGQFSLQTAQPVKSINVEYMGLKPVEKKRARQDMTIRMSDDMRKKKFFIGPEISLTGTNGAKPAFGAMFGFVKNWGVYGKAVLSGTPVDDGGDVDLMNGKEKDYYTGKIHDSFISLTAGLMFRVWNDLYVYGGAGMQQRVVEWQKSDDLSGSYDEYEPDSYYKYGIEFGALMMWKHFYATAGTQFAVGNFDNDHTNYQGGKTWVLNFGVGVNF